jgi:hypothetical protein
LIIAKSWQKSREINTKTLKNPESFACISERNCLYSKQEVGESGAECHKVVTLSQVVMESGAASASPKKEGAEALPSLCRLL